MFKFCHQHTAQYINTQVQENYGFKVQILGKNSVHKSCKTAEINNG